MAPKGGKGGGGKGSGGGIEASCPGAFAVDEYGHSAIPAFASYCVFFVVTLGILIASSKIKKKQPWAKKLLGWIYTLSLLFTVLAYALIIIATVLDQCHKGKLGSFYLWGVAFNLFFRLGTYLLLVVSVYSVNDLYRKYHGHNPSYFKIIYAVILGILGALTCAYIGVSCYNFWASSEVFTNSDVNFLGIEEAKLEVAYWTLYLIGVFVAGALALTTLVSMRSRGAAPGSLSSLMGWTGVHFAAMALWVIFALALAAINLESYSIIFQRDLFDTRIGLIWVEDIFQMLSWISLLFIAKSTLFAADPSAPVAPVVGKDQTLYNQAQAQQPVQQQQPLSYTFHAGPPPQVPQQYQQAPPPQQQQYYYQSQPVYNGGAVPVNGNGQVGQFR